MYFLKAHNAVTFFLTGLIWIVQLVHYPMFAAIDASRFRKTHEFHSTRISYIVAPAMLAELILAVVLLMRRDLPLAARASALGLVLLIWAVTFLIMIPFHQRLASGDRIAENISSLVRWNWIRTIAWSARAAICFFYF